MASSPSSRPPDSAGMSQLSASPSGSQAGLVSPASTPSKRRSWQQRLLPSKEDALSSSLAAAKIGKGVASNFSVPGLGIGLSALVEVLTRMQAVLTISKGVDQLKEDVGKLLGVISDLQARHTDKELPPVMQQQIEELTSEWTKIEGSGAKLTRGNILKRLWKSGTNTKKLEDLVAGIKLSIQVALLQGLWDVQAVTHGLQERLDDKIEPKLDAIAAQEDERFIPPHAESAAYDAISARPRQPCLEGTREDILGDAWAWVKLRTRDPTPANNTEEQGGALVSTKEAQDFIHWTCGLAGTGKTTIACSIAKSCEEEHVLGGSFFFSRFDSKCDNPRLLFTTISYQLLHAHPEYKAKVLAAIKAKPTIVDAVPAVQFEKLILEPLEQLTEPFPRLAIVLDALDECRSDDNTSTIFYILSRFQDRVIRFFVFIITSRPDPDIVVHFDQLRSGSLGEMTTRLFLHTVELQPVLQDINRFLTYHLKDTASGRFPHGRPSDEDITALSTLSEGLFIFARTIVNLLIDKKSYDPVATLERIVQRQSHRSDSVSILYELYSQVLDEAHPNAEEELQDLIRQIVGTLVVAVEPLAATTLAALLGLSAHVVRNVLSELYSVLHLPDEDSQPIHFIHPTFPEFLLQVSPALSLPSGFSFSATEQHCAVVIRCLMTTKALLRYDIAGLRDPAVFKKEVSDLPGRIQQRVPSHLSYACRNWIIHFRLCGGALMPTAVHTLFSNFLHENLLYWLEVCILINMLNEVPAVLDAAWFTCHSLEEPFSDLTPFLLDARRFVLTYAPWIDTAPLQVYHSALGLAPCSSLVSQTYSDIRLKRSLAVCRGGLQVWEPGLDSFSGHGDRLIYAVAFSPNNTFLVSGGNDGMVKVWQASTRVLVLDIQASSGCIYAVAYSPNGLHIAVGDDKGLSIWHAASGAQIRVISDDEIRQVAYTVDGSRLLSINIEGKVQLWHESDGVCLLSLDGNREAQASISPDGAVIAFTRGASLLLHDVSSGKHEGLALPDKGEEVTFSPDGRYVAAATNREIRIWSRQDKSPVRSIDVPASIWSGLSFSPDGSRICCGCNDESLYVWPVEGDGPVRELKGHTRMVRDVAWSPDGSQIVSASRDGTIRLWDVSDHLPTGQPRAVLPTRPSSGPPRILVAKYKDSFTVLKLPPQPVSSLFLPSRNGSAAHDAPTFTAHPNHAAAWDHIAHSTETWLPDYPWATLTGQNKYSTGATAAVSNNGSLVAYATSRDIYIYSLTTGEPVATLTPEFGSGNIYSIVFSPGDSRLASGSRDPAAVAVWDVAAGACVAYHHNHSKWICCVTFSSDGRFVVSGSGDKTARVFDIFAKQVTCVLGPHNDWVLRVMLTTDDRLLVTQDDSGALYIWDIESGSRIASFPSSKALWIATLHFSPTGFSVSLEDGEHAVELWKAGDRAWPVYNISKEGWVYAKGPGYTRRLAWLPPEWRHPVCSDGAIFCVGERETYGRMTKVVELDMSRLLGHVGISYIK